MMGVPLRMKYEIPKEIIEEAIRLEEEIKLEDISNRHSNLYQVLLMRLETLGANELAKACMQYRMEKDSE